MIKILTIIFMACSFSSFGGPSQENECRTSKFLKTKFCVGDYVYNSSGGTGPNLVGQVIGVINDSEFNSSVMALMISDWDLPLLMNKTVKKGYWKIQTMNLTDIEKLDEKSKFGQGSINSFRTFKKNWSNEIVEEVNHIRKIARVPITINPPLP